MPPLVARDNLLPQTMPPFLLGLNFLVPSIWNLLKKLKVPPQESAPMQVQVQTKILPIIRAVLTTIEKISPVLQLISAFNNPQKKTEST